MIGSANRVNIQHVKNMRGCFQRSSKRKYLKVFHFRPSRLYHERLIMKFSGQVFLLDYRHEKHFAGNDRFIFNADSLGQ